MSPLQIISGKSIKKLEEWSEYAPHGRDDHWQAGCSTYELAKRWLRASWKYSNGLPPEVEEVLASRSELKGLIALRAYAEMLTEVDECSSRTRQHDLVVIGEVNKQRVLMDIEGIGDERFDKSIAKKLKKKKDDPESTFPQRVNRLAQAIFGLDAESISELRYQLLFNVAATLVRARLENASMAVFLVHEFRKPEQKKKKLEANAQDLEEFIKLLLERNKVAAASQSINAPQFLMGPFAVRGTPANDANPIPSNIPLYIGKAMCELK